MIDRIKDWYTDLEKAKKVRVKQLILVLTVVIIASLVFVNKSNKVARQTSQDNKNQTKNIQTPDDGLFQNEITEEVNMQMSLIREDMAAKDKKISALEDALEVTLLMQQNASVKNENNQSFPSNINEEHNQISNQVNFDTDNMNNEISPQWVGGIIHEEYSYSDLLATKESKQAGKKKIIKFSPGFMKGYLLTGMDAMTLDGASDTPEPMIIRVQAPAVLPNEVRINLEGCFVIAEGYGNLATHRVDAKLVSISCIDYSGNSLIYEKIKGFIQDGDGKRGIKGQPIHRAGANVARSILAGIFEGVGNGISGSAQTTNISALGQQNTVASNNIGKVALGSGLTSGAADVKNLFLELAKQSSPVIEVGAGKHISVVITDPVNLNIEELNNETYN